MTDRDRCATEGLEFCCRVTIAKEMIDYNGHLNVGYYGVIFEDAARTLFPQLDISRGYHEREQKSFFAAELHQVFREEVMEGETVTLLSRILEFDGRKLHVAYLMIKENGALAASQEILYLHVDRLTRKVVPVPAPQATRLRDLRVRHSELPPFEDAGRSVGIRSRPRS